MDRRRFLAATAAAGLTAGFGASALPGLLLPSAAGTRWPHRRAALPDFPFTLGVASGDPLADRVILWTRLAPAPLQGGGMPAEAVEVTWEVATDATFATVVRSGTYLATPDEAHSVHVDADGLDPDTWYSYRFSVEGWQSPAGRTRTTPTPDSCRSDARLRFGVATCQNWTAGYYTAHAHLANEDIDAVFFLGDYIYEGGVGNGLRPHNSSEVTTLGAYRNRYGLYKGDPNLQAAHAAAPWIVTWDDHEVENNYAGAVSENDDDPATFLVRRAAAYRAWWEHQPVRVLAPTGPDLQIYRAFSWGTLARFHVLDGRQYRSDQPCGDGFGPVCDEVDDPDQTMLGAAQEAWLDAGLASSTATWNVIPQQVVVAALPIGDIRIFDLWDGYPLARQRLLDRLATTRNPLVLTGDIHSAGATDLLADFSNPTSAVIGTEIVATSISSTFPPDLGPALEAVVNGLPWSHYVNTRNRGYALVELTPEGMQTDFRVVSTVTETTATVSTDFSLVREIDAEECATPPTTSSTSSTSRPPDSTSTTSSTRPLDSTSTTPSVGDAGGAPFAPTADPVAVAADFVG